MTIQELYERTDGDYEAAKHVMQMDKLIARFVAKLPADQCMPKLSEAVGKMDYAGIFESAHGLKGVCGNLGFLKLAAMAAELTDEFRPGRERKLSDDEVKAKFLALKAKYDLTVKEIEAFTAQ